MLEAVKAVYLSVSQGRDRLLRLVDRQRVLSRRLLAVAAKVEVVVARRKPLERTEEAVFRRVDGLLGDTDRGSELQVRIDTLLDAQQQQQHDALGGGLDSDGGSKNGILSGTDTAQLLRQLEFSHRAIDQLFVVVRRDARDLLILRNHLAALSGQ